MLTFRAVPYVSLPFAIPACHLPLRIIWLTCNDGMISLSIHKSVSWGCRVGAAKRWEVNTINTFNLPPGCHKRSGNGATYTPTDCAKLYILRYAISLYCDWQKTLIFRIGNMHICNKWYLERLSQNMRIHPHCLPCWQFVFRQSWKSSCTGVWSVSHPGKR